MSVPMPLALRSSAVTYPGTAEHISGVRSDLRSVLNGCPMADDLILCASELATNAALHSRSRLTGGTFTVRVVISLGRYARIEVQDDGGPWSPAAGDRARHRGLGIVCALASEWGVDHDDGTRIVWARFDWPEQP